MTAGHRDRRHAVIVEAAIGRSTRRLWLCGRPRRPDARARRPTPYCKQPQRISAVAHPRHKRETNARRPPRAACRRRPAGRPGDRFRGDPRASWPATRHASDAVASGAAGFGRARPATRTATPVTAAGVAQAARATSATLPRAVADVAGSGPRRPSSSADTTALDAPPSSTSGPSPARRPSMLGELERREGPGHRPRGPRPGRDRRSTASPAGSPPAT